MATLGGDISRIVFGIQSKIKKLVKLVKLVKLLKGDAITA